MVEGRGHLHYAGHGPGAPVLPRFRKRQRTADLIDIARFLAIDGAFGVLVAGIDLRAVPGQTIGLKARTLMFRTPDGISLYGAVFGSGHAGAVLANDVPHQICEEVPAAAWFAQRGLRTIVFDYRGHGESEIGSDPGRLDLDVAGAAAELRRLGVARVLLVGSYAGVAATVVASTKISPAVEGVIGFSPAPSRGQYVNGPFDPIGALQAAPRMRPPALYVTVRGDQYVPVAEVERLYRATGSREKRLVVVGYGPASWDLLDFSPFMRRVDRLVEGFIRAHG